MKMVFQVFFDSVCRCLGSSSMVIRKSGTTSTDESGSIRGGSESIEEQREAGHQAQRTRPEPRSTKAGSLKNLIPQEDDGDKGYAQMLAEAKISSNLRRKSSRSRNMPDIFRARRCEVPTFDKQGEENKGNTFSCFLSNHQGFMNSVCFANPIHDDDDDELSIVLSPSESSATNTLNTCEDTITSTLYFEAKYSHIVEDRPPMPLFDDFKVGTGETDQLRRIVATDSHSSRSMIHLF